METQTQEKYLFHLTAKEYASLIKNIIEELVPNLVRKELEELQSISYEKQKPEKDSLTVSEAAEFTGLKLKSVYSKVSRLQMPVITRGRPLLFSRQQLNEWMREGRPTVAEMMYKDYMEKRNKKRN
jgi:excisionase family DNA binding protein